MKKVHNGTTIPALEVFTVGAAVIKPTVVVWAVVGAIATVEVTFGAVVVIVACGATGIVG